LIGAHSTLPIGEVISTDPLAGTKVTKGQHVNVVWSEGPKTVSAAVPNVVTDSAGAAEETLSLAHFGYSVTYTLIGTGGALPGTVIAQNPPALTMEPQGYVVVITVVQSGATFSVPDVYGESVSEASSTLGANQLTVSSTMGSVCSNSVTSGNVATTTPPRGAQVTSGQSIQLNLSSGSCVETVPNVTGDTQEAANNALEAAPYNYVPVYNTLSSSSTTCQGDPPDYVVDTVPAAGSELQSGSNITVDYCPPAGTTNAPRAPHVHHHRARH
jgi:serine/threonine-protein kinase